MILKFSGLDTCEKQVRRELRRPLELGPMRQMGAGQLGAHRFLLRRQNDQTLGWKIGETRAFLRRNEGT